MMILTINQYEHGSGDGSHDQCFKGDESDYHHRKVIAAPRGSLNFYYERY